MLRRTLALWLAATLEPLRSPLAWLGLLSLAACVPLLVLVFGEGEAPARAWLARSIVVEVLRWLLPLGALAGAAFAIRPSLRSGWAALPARRAEWFFAVSAASFCLMFVCALCFVAGAALSLAALGEAGNLEQSREAASFTHTARAQGGETVFIWPGTAETLEFEFVNAGLPPDIKGAFEFEIAWTRASAPERDVPFSVTLVGERTVEAATRVEARRRASFAAPNPGGESFKVLCRATDPALTVGMKRASCRIEGSRPGPLASLGWLLMLSLAGAALCASVALCVRALATAPTAALAGLLLLVALTLLPALSPGDFASRKRRQDVERQAESEASTLQQLAVLASRLPRLMEPADFERFMAGRAAGGEDARGALLRLLIAAGLLPAGALMFGRRQIA
ncbi:hypothetical protein EDM80_00160 [bacterium]|nr:MAG: hypothetical protein EDM80_00160 [bacterium]RIK65589.1 MAG: hypothetical protein DCC64_00270 [Planctomycetota bacterium]